MLLLMRIMRIIWSRGELLRFREIEKMVLDDGWVFKNAKGSHNQYIHPAKPGKVTIPNHPGDISPVIVKSILRQAGIEEGRS